KMIAVKIAAEKAKRTRRSPICSLNRFLVRDRVDWCVSLFLGSTGYQPVVAGSLPATSLRTQFRGDVVSRSRQAAETYRLAACAPQKRAERRSSAQRAIVPSFSATVLPFFRSLITNVLFSP